MEPECAIMRILRSSNKKTSVSTVRQVNHTKYRGAMKAKSVLWRAKSKFQLETPSKNYEDSDSDTSTSTSESVKPVIPLLSSARSHRNRSGGSDSPDQQSDDSDEEIGAGILEVVESSTGPDSTTAAGQLCQSVADIDQDWMAACTEEAVSFFCALQQSGQVEKLYQADCLAVPPPPAPPTPSISS